MTNEETRELFKHSETLKKQALKLFEDKDIERVVYALLHAGTQVIKQQKDISFLEATYKALAILAHLDQCPECKDPTEGE
jgi:hypothetical protein